LKQSNVTKAGPSPALFDLGLHGALAVVVLGGLYLFYSSVYWVHQDLGGSALSGLLAVTLGSAFEQYVAYFPPAERVWFSAAALLSNISGIRLDVTAVLMTGLAILFATGLAYRIRKVSGGASPLFLILSVGFFTILPILFKNIFGLREHMVALGLWPYLVLRVSDPEGTRTSRPLKLLVGLWMGAMLLFKYVYSVVIFLVEVADAAAQRRPQLLFRMENLIAAGIVALYLFTWLVLNPAQRGVIGVMMSSIDANLADPKTNWLSALSNLYWVVFFWLAYRIFKLPVRVMALGIALVLGAIAAAWIQHRWYTHHVFPITLAYIAWWWIAAPYFKWWGHAVMALYSVAPIASQYQATVIYQQSADELDRALQQAGRSLRGKRVAVLTMHPSPYNEYLAARGGTRWTANMNNAYVAAELKPLDRPEQANAPAPPVKLDDPGRRMLHDEMLRLWEDMPPDVLILDHSYRWPLHYLDVEWTRVFANDARFNAVLKRYRPVLAHRGKRLEFKYFVRVR